LKRIVVDETYCKGCGLCIDQCPKKVLGTGTKRNSRGYVVPEVVLLEECVACTICERICPDMAITVEGKEDEKRG
jgi:2-oxoglutarate ferredoxin oxidoreductase subunit delta